MKYLVVLIFILLSACTVRTSEKNKDRSDEKVMTISKGQLLDKIKGGWAGQVIGCTYGGPTEFKYNGTIIGDNTPIPWDKDQMKWWFENASGLYDDVYMDLTFVDVFEKYGLGAPDSLHALAFANAAYPLWHANQAARYNILNGIMPPKSGYWKNNPHADDIDFQIEADFAGLMSPGMVNTASEIASRIGHIMNFGDGIYGGIFVASMYSLAFISSDIEFVVSEALKKIPEQSKFYKCISDIINWHKQNPDDWKSTWFEAQKKWTDETGCPDGVFKAFNIDAKINAAYIVIGLLYGQGDFGKTIDISTRCGFDSDCNPANAAGILGTIIGYENIPEIWREGLAQVEGIDFPYTKMSLSKVYEIGYKHALENILNEGGDERDGLITIKKQDLVTMPVEVAFEGIYPVDRKSIGRNLSKENDVIALAIKGSGFVLTGYTEKSGSLEDVILEADLLVDHVVVERIKMPSNWLTRKHEVAWNYDLREGEHLIEIRAVNLPPNYTIKIEDVITYSTVEPLKQTLF